MLVSYSLHGEKKLVESLFLMLFPCAHQIVTSEEGDPGTTIYFCEQHQFVILAAPVGDEIRFALGWAHEKPAEIAAKEKAICILNCAFRVSS